MLPTAHAPGLLFTALASLLAPALTHAAANACGECAAQQCSTSGQCGRFPLQERRVRLSDEPGGATPEVQLHSNYIDSPDGRRYVLKDAVRLRKGEQVLRANRLQWQRDTGAFRAADQVFYQNHGLLLEAPSMAGNTSTGSGQASDVAFRLRQSRGNGHAGHVQLLENGDSTLSAVAYSTCSPEHRQWELRAGHIAIDQDQHVGHARDVTMRLGGVPFLWLPWLRFPTTNQRQSGLLYPTIGYSDSRGVDIVVPWYLNLAPNYDATLYPRILSRRGVMLGGEFRYLTGNTRGIVRADYLAHDRLADDTRSLVRARSRTRLSSLWSFDININHVSDRSYFEDLGSSLYGNATHLLHSKVYFNGRGRNWHVALGGDQYQITDPDLPSGHEPYKRLPRAVFGGHARLGRHIDYGVTGEFVHFHKDHGLDGQRLDVMPWINWRLEGPWWHVDPKLAWRSTTYHLDRDTASSPSRNLPIASLDAGLVFERDASLFGTSYTQTLEPRAYYLRVPYRDQSDIPIFDTSYQTFGYWQMFSPNHFAGADRQMNANNLTLALTSRLLDDSGVERVAASIGQIRYFDPQRVQLPGRAQTDYSGSAYVAYVRSRLSPKWHISLAQQWNPNGDHTDLSAIRLQHQMWNNGILNFSYRYRRNYLEQFDVSTLFPLTNNWNVVARWNYALGQQRTLGALAGIEYQSCCLNVRIVGRHYVRNSAGDIDNSILLQIEFKGIGSLGQNAGELLQHAILGYSENGLAVPGRGLP